MNGEEIDKALQRFGQVENVMTRERQGTGLSLPLVRELALLHGGSVEIESEPGEGTTVTVRFGADRVLPAGRSADARAGTQLRKSTDRLSRMGVRGSRQNAGKQGRR